MEAPNFEAVVVTDGALYLSCVKAALKLLLLVLVWSDMKKTENILGIVISLRVTFSSVFGTIETGNPES